MALIIPIRDIVNWVEFLMKKKLMHEPNVKKKKKNLKGRRKFRYCFLRKILASICKKRQSSQSFIRGNNINHENTSHSLPA